VGQLLFLSFDLRWTHFNFGSLPKVCRGSSTTTRLLFSIHICAHSPLTLATATMATANDSFETLERHRKALEQNVDKLSEALDEWRQWKLEYEALKKDVTSLPPDAPPALLGDTRSAYMGDLVDATTLADIFGKKNEKKRDQVLSVLANRIDYVDKNITTLEKQLQAAENKLAAANVITNPDLPEDEDGLPITEIMEELDDEDNVVSYSLRTPGRNQSQLMQVLEKAGLKELPSTETKAEAQQDATDDAPQIPKPSNVTNGESPRLKSQKAVAFADDTKPADKEPRYMSLPATKVDQLMREAKDQEDMISDPVIPEDESDEEARLRRDMLQYNLSELNPVVAELTLEEGDFSDDDDFEFDYDDNDEDDDEDQWGRSTSSVMNEDYRRKMLEIQARLSGHQFGSTAEAASDGDADMQEGLGRIRVKTDEAPANPGSANKPKATSDGKKSVRFASALDIAEHKTLAESEAAPAKQTPRKPEVDPLSDTIVERKSNSKPAQAVAAPGKKTSRFKKAQSGQASGQPPLFSTPLSSGGSTILPDRPSSDQPFAPSGPEGLTLAETVLEHGPSTPREPDEFDADLLKQQAAVEYHKLRNRMIQKQGGFMKEDESPIQPLDEEEGGPKRMSRFKAARLAKS
jgi:unconventional prefoldin RPB5 interactor 1